MVAECGCDKPIPFGDMFGAVGGSWAEAFEDVFDKVGGDVVVVVEGMIESPVRINSPCLS